MTTDTTVTGTGRAKPRTGRVLTLAAECAVPCPACGAEADAACTTKDGRPNRVPHNPRRRAWQEWITTQRPAAPAAGHHDPIAVDGAGTATPLSAAVEEVETLTKEELAVRLAVLKVLEAKIAEVQADHRAQARHALHTGDQVAAYLTPEDAKAGRNALGRLGKSKPRESWRVTDVDAFTRWVEENRPTEIETKPAVRNSYLTAVLAACKVDGGILDPATGEVVCPPGIELGLGDPVVTMRLADGAAELVGAALAAGRLRLEADGTPALPAGGAE